MDGAFVVVKIITSVKLRYLANLTVHEGFRFDLIQLILLDHLANRMVTTIQHVVGNNCKYEPLSSSTNAIREDHALLY